MPCGRGESGDNQTRKDLAKLWGMRRKEAAVHDINTNDRLVQNGRNGLLDMRLDSRVSNGFVESVKPRKSSIGRTEVKSITSSVARAKAVDKSACIAQSSAIIRSVVNPAFLQHWRSFDCAMKDDHAKPIGQEVQTGRSSRLSVTRAPCGR